MKISIITINYNNAVGLQKTIASVVSQSYSNIEYIIIDGGSLDGSKETILQNNDKISYWLSEKDRGVYHAMNKGIEKATGDYILFLNSGDYLHSRDTIKHIIPFLNHDIVFGNLMEMHSDGKFKECHFSNKLTFSYLAKHYLPHPSSFIKTQVLKYGGSYDEKYTIVADWAFFLKAIGKYNATYHYVPQIISVYNLEGISAKEENQAKIKTERELFLKEEFELFYPDYQKLLNLENDISSFKASNLYKNLVLFLGYKIRKYFR